MLVGRFSDYGFTPLFQNHLKQQVDWMKSFDEREVGLSGHALEMVKLGVTSRLADLNPDFTFWGIHIFFLPLREEDMRFFMNHAKSIPGYHEQFIDDSTLGHVLDDPFNKPLITLRELFDKGYVGAYVSRESFIGGQ
jgi:hypothetical protein